MNKKKFKKKIDKANTHLLKKYNDGYDYYFKYENWYENGVCDALSKAFDLSGLYTYNEVGAIVDFVKLFKPKYSRKSYWLGRRIEANLEKRQLALRLFEQYAIDNRLYKEY